jgi:hypothetical protein
VVLIACVHAVSTPRLNAGVEYQDPVGGWRYLYGGTFNPGVVDANFIGGVGPAGYGTTGDRDALDGTWLHTQGDKWDGSAPGDTGPAPNGPAPGGAASLTEGEVTFIRVQDAGNPEAFGYVQAQGGQLKPTNTNRRVYFGRTMSQDGPFLPPVAGREGQRVLDNGITVSFRMRIPNDNSLDDIYAGGATPQILPWFESPPGDYNSNGTVDAADYPIWRKHNNQPVQLANEVEGVSEGMVTDEDYDEWKKRYGSTGNLGRGYPVHDDGRGMITIAQFNGDENDPFYGTNGTIAFSLLTSKDIEALCNVGGGGTICTGSGSGGLLMNNRSGDAPNQMVDVFDPGQTLNLLEIPDDQLDDWHEFWITIVDNGATAGTHAVNVYMDGATTPTTFNVTVSGNNNSAYHACNDCEDTAYLEFGLSSNDLFGSMDMDFYSYSLDVIAPIAAGSGGSNNAVPEPGSIAFFLPSISIIAIRRKVRTS